jgi:UDP-N-acetylmuramyl pentapeptide phosphotransferase/UDP-N-acetylglucosamine-1-phosphate transferase
MRAVLLVIGSAIATAGLITLMKPLLIRYALARPNARSSHKEPTPQGGGIAIVALVSAVAIAFASAGVAEFRQPWVAGLVTAIVVLAVVGAVDDLRPLPVVPRLLLQVAVATLMVATLPTGARILPWIPATLESVGLVVGLVWFINLTNFMDGIDLMTVVETVPILVVAAGLGMSGLVPALGACLPVILALLGGLIGFAPFNRHVARLFLGDVGSLPIGALVGWLMIVLATAGQPVAALILPLYYLSDATITLVRRFMRGENISEAHRSHFYQIATTRGFSVPQVTWFVLGLNALLGVLAVVTVAAASPVVSLLSLALALVATLLLLRNFERGRLRQGSA